MIFSAYHFSYLDSYAHNASLSMLSKATNILSKRDLLSQYEDLMFPPVLVSAIRLMFESNTHCAASREGGNSCCVSKDLVESSDHQNDIFSQNQSNLLQILQPQLFLLMLAKLQRPGVLSHPFTTMTLPVMTGYLRILGYRKHCLRQVRWALEKTVIQTQFFKFRKR